MCVVGAMPRSSSVSAVPRRLYANTNASTGSAKRPVSPASSSSPAVRGSSLEVLDPLNYPPSPREYDSWPCDSFFLLPDSVLSMDAGAFRADLTSIDPALSASLPDWGNKLNSKTPVSLRSSYRRTNHERSGVSLRHSHQGLTVTSAGQGTILIGGGGGNGDGRDNNMTVGSGASAAAAAAAAAAVSPTPQGVQVANSSLSPAGSSPVPNNAHSSDTKEPQQKDALLALTSTAATTAGVAAAPPPHHNLTTKPQLAGPNELFFGTGAERSSSVSHRDREERLRQLRERQQQERQHKLEELKEHAAAAQRFREQQEAQRRQRLQELRSRDQDRRTQVEERRRYIEQADMQRREASVKKNVDRDQRLETKRRNERSNIVFAFGSSTPRMLDPKENASYWGARRATSISNVTLGAEGSGGSSSGSGARRSSDCVDGSAAAATGGAVAAPELARKRAASAQGLDRNPNDLRMSSSMYEVFHWTDHSTGYSPNAPQGGDDLISRSMTASVARRRTDLHPITPSLRDSTSSTKPRRRSPGRAVSMSRLDQLAKPRQYPHLLAPLHEKDSERMSSCSPHSRTRSMTHLAGGRSGSTARALATSEATAKTLNKQLSRSSAALVRSTRAEHLRQQARLTSGGRSGGTTPNTLSSRPTSALSQTSGNVAPGTGVTLRARTTPRKPRPMSIGGSAPSAADRPRSPAGREGRTAVRNMSSGSLSSVKSTRAKSVGGSDSSAPPTPAKTAPTAPPRTPKRTPAQVKADSNAKKAANAAAAKRPTPKATPVGSPNTESKPLTLANAKLSEEKVKDEVKSSDVEKDEESTSTLDLDQDSVVISNPVVLESALPGTGTTEIVSTVANDESATMMTSETTEVLMTTEEPGPSVDEEPAATIEATNDCNYSSETKVVTEIISTTVTSEETIEDTQVHVEVLESTVAHGREIQVQTVATETNPEEESLTAATESVKVGPNSEEASDETLAFDQSDLGTTDDAKNETVGGATQSEDRPVAGYATEEEYKAVLAEKRRLAREAREREIELERKREEEEAEKERREEEEMLRLMEEQKKAEEERLRLAIEQADREREDEIKRKAEEEKQRLETERLEAERQKEAQEKLRKEEEERKSRKNRVAAIMARTRKGGSVTPNKTESKTPSDEGKTISEVLLKANLTDSMIDKMSDSMIAAATIDSESESCQASSGVSSQPMSDVSSQPNSDVSSSQAAISDASSQGTLENSTVDTSGASSLEQTVQSTLINSQDCSVDLLSAAVADLTMHQHTNGNAIPDNTNAPQSIQLLGSINGHTNGVLNSSHENSSVDLLGSFDPITLDAALGDQNRVNLTSTEDFEQIIDAGQTKLTNEDALNSNPPAEPFIAFEQNLNRKTAENNASVPDLLM